MFMSLLGIFTVRENRAIAALKNVIKSKLKIKKTFLNPNKRSLMKKNQICFSIKHISRLA